MRARERVLTSLAQREPDRVPFMYRDIPEVRSRLLKDLKLGSDEELLEMLGIDFRWVQPEYVGPKMKRGDGKIRSIFGIEYLYRRGAGGGYWEPEKFPLSEVENPAQLEEHPWPTVKWFDFSVIEEQLNRYEEYAIMSAPTVYCSPGVLTVLQDLFGMEKTLVDMYANPELWHATA